MEEGSPIPLLTTLLRPLIGSSVVAHKGDTSKIDRALGATFTIGVSVMMLRFAAQALLGHSHVKKKGGSTVLLSYCYIMIRNWILQLGDAGRLKEEEEDNEEDSVSVIHCGSCHCRSIDFTLQAPANVRATLIPGKIQYPFIRTDATSFQLSKGSQHLSTYYVTIPSPSSLHNKKKTAAHAFCSRCGVHILRAPDSKKNLLEVNVNCLNDLGVNKITIEEKKGEDRGGVPLPNQWDEEEHIRQQPQDQSQDSSNDMEETVTTATNTSVLSPGSNELFSIASVKSSSSPYTQMKSFDHDSIGGSSSSSTVSTPIGSINHWAVGSSLQTQSTSISLDEKEFMDDSTFRTMPSLEGKGDNVDLRVRRSHTGGTGGKLDATATPILRDQLKYYMNRHLNQPPRSDQGNG